MERYLFKSLFTGAKWYHFLLIRANLVLLWEIKRHDLWHWKILWQLLRLLTAIKYARFVASRALKHVLYLAEIFIFSFHLMHALTAELTILLVEQWVKPRPGGSYLMGRCISGKARIHLNKNTGLKSEAHYPLYPVSGIKPFPLWQVLVHNQEYRHCHWGGKHTQQPAKKRGARLLVYNAITHMCRQNNMASGKKYKVYLNLNYLFLLLTEITAIPRFSQSLQWEQGAWSLLLLRAPYLWNIFFLQSRTTTF